jgi:ubiquinone/menaquinone biosynthesis C-methylase UbiE/DNA-binding MarR family transcriptional regulator
MKPGAVPDSPIEWLLLKANQIPTPLIDTFSAMMNAKAILAANELGLFNALAEGPLEPSLLAKRLGVTERGVTDVTDALCANGYLTRDEDRLDLTDVSRKWLARSSPDYIGHMLEHINDLWAIWSNLEEAIRIGRPPASDYGDWLNDENYRSILRRHILGLRETARFTASEIVRNFEFSAESVRLLDIGGGHAGYAIAFCEQNPNLTATVFDLAPTAEIGRGIVEREEMSERIKFQVGDFLRDDFEQDYDAALYFNIIHNFSEEDNRIVLGKAFHALRPGGALAVWDMFKSKDKQRDIVPALMALHMLVASGGTSYQLDDVMRWLTEIGFITPTLEQTRTQPGFSMIIVRKP